MRSVQKVSSHVIWKIETFIEEDTRYKKHCTQDNDASVPFKVGTLGPHTVLPITISCPVILSWISSMVWNLFSFKGDFSFGEKPEVTGHQTMAIGRLSHLGDLMFHQKTTGDVMHEQACCHDEAAPPVAAAFCIIPIVYSEECSTLMQNLMQIRCSTHSFWIWWQHSTHAHSRASTAPTD